MASSSSVVISFSIAILLLLILLLLLSYNSKSKQVDKFERFETPPAAYDNYSNYKELFSNNIFNVQSEPSNELPPPPSTDINKDKKNPNVDIINKGLEGILPADSSKTFTDFNNNYETFNNLSTQEEVCRDPITCGYKKDQLTAKELLPADASDLKWSQTNPTGSAEIVDQGLLTAGYHIGLNQVCKKNANLQLRSELPNPQYAVSPWMISTIDNCNKDTDRNFEIGSSVPSV